MNNRITELQHEIDQLKQRQEEAALWVTRIHALKDYADTEKIAAFDRLYQQAYDYLKEIAETGHAPKDGDHYLFEAIMEETMGPEVWEVSDSL